MRNYFLCALFGLAVLAFAIINNHSAPQVQAVYRTPKVTKSVSVTKGQHSILGAPTISADQIEAIYRLHGNPALADLAQQIYDLGQQTGIDPVWLVAISFNESDFGTAGEATKSLSIGNPRCLDQQHYGDLGTWCQDGYAFFPSWLNGIKAAYRLLKSNLYVGGGLTTIEKVIYRWAPWGDKNNPPHYVRVLVAAANLWRSGSTSLPTGVA